MRHLKDNLLVQFSVVSFVVILALGILISVILSTRLNRNIEHLAAHSVAMDNMMHAAGMGHVTEHDTTTAGAMADDAEMEGHTAHDEAMAHATAGDTTGDSSTIGSLMIRDSDVFSIPSMEQDIRNLQWTSAGLVAGAFVVLYLALVSTVWRGWRTIKRQQDILTGTNEDMQAANEHLSDTQERLALILNSAGEGIYGVDLHGHTTFANPAAAKMIGWEAQKLIGKPMHEIVYRAQSNEAPYSWDKSPIYAALSSGDTHYVNDDVFWRQDGTNFPVEYVCTPIREHKEIRGVVVIFRDITDRKWVEEERVRLETQLRQSQKMETVGTLAGGIAHDLNNMLTPIIGYTEMTLDDLPPESQARADMERVLEVAQRAKEVVHQILTFSRQVEQEYRPVQIHLVLKEALTFLRASLPPIIEIRQDVEAACGTVMADPTQIHQVLMNLCINAYHAMRERGGVLAVSQRVIDVDEAFVRVHPGLREGPYIRLSISDTGHGMDKATVERIFEPFFTTKGVGEGTGLGLSMVHGIITNHDGAITVYSEPGQGTTFHIYLPRTHSDVGRASPEDEPILKGDERILFVDDEEEIALMGKQMLESLGYGVTVKTNSLEARDAFYANPDNFDLVVADQTMPQMDGAQLAEELIQFRPGIPIILASGFSEIITAEQRSKLGIGGFVMKPFVAQDLGRTVRQILDQEPERVVL